MSMFGAVDLSALAQRQEPAATAPGAPGADGEAPVYPAPLVVDLTAENLRDVAQVSTEVPVVVVALSPRSQVSVDVAAQLARLAVDMGGRFELARLDADAAPQVAQALQVTAVPTVLALLAGQPVPMFQGAAADEQLRQLLDQLLELAAANGVRGRVAVDADQAPAEPEETEVERAAREAMERGDYAAAIEVYDHAVAQNPGDETLKVARSQVRVLARMDGKDPRALLAAADAAPEDVEAALAGADAALALGDIDAALGRALEVVRSHTGEERERARLRLLELFDVIGASAPEVARARRQLATLLF
ncbi:MULTISPECIES: tetratricopeptide repeat protein [unclassified Actinomyces]|uniref:tetratricopeptide repeat protein n=1 Tax=unclassified Actinomyces TaxID=2609248 RepID=UPI002017BD45|nr:MULTISPECIES: tetratricopeptide repeat protein [unclassified Actinomyces]MCL3778087.1 tetratricopeptide repeat protein [Actinomyces sp. AC-20-1]MCL3790352.1 tetratricopeptide repeat protein [Actinomyces sp. 187325]MCL3791808.1 tetratricopeptide repeat protein [Actinomyces sp. 186855]MCL3794349.1 tetratricopeptide repeat protein [Actinomyces sp. 217892]